MKRKNYLRYALELIVILGYLVIGVSVLTYTIHHIPMDHVFIGFIILSTGIIEFADFFTWKYPVRIRSIQSVLTALVAVGLGAVFIFIKMEMKLLCVLFGIYGIFSALAKTVTGALNLSRQPLLNTIRIVLSIVEIVFSILLIIRTTYSLYSHMLFLGIALTVLTFTLLIEYIVHRYQNYSNL